LGKFVKFPAYKIEAMGHASNPWRI
jgi:hypothetical protein